MSYLYHNLYEEVVEVWVKLFNNNIQKNVKKNCIFFVDDPTPPTRPALLTHFLFFFSLHVNIPLELGWFEMDNYTKKFCCKKYLRKLKYMYVYYDKGFECNDALTFFCTKLFAYICVSDHFFWRNVGSIPLPPHM